VALALQYATLVAELEGREGGGLAHADRGCYRAHASRYGPLSKPLYKKAMRLYDALS
jgi:hypothetical protein